eukprot:TRINITY_DN23976_c0_g1_i1.p1 TRINITY_DN23976_c0_g1~~TRINITY_DN23976_c0_g1_i1.p1  ORF type:complete len:179 (+),score=39.80 TRINITY_DN23976_c0_g1_i1:40-576(+)
MDEKTEKRPFDKKAWRKKQYDKKSRIDAWQGQRKAHMTTKYKRMLKKEKPQGLDVQKIYSEDKNPNLLPLGGSDKPVNNSADGNSSLEKSSSGQSKPWLKKKSSFQKAQQKYTEKKSAKEKKIEEAQQRRAEREAKLKIYREKKNKRSKVMNARTKKGQPLMGDRIQLLLEKIQASST